MAVVLGAGVALLLTSVTIMSQLLPQAALGESEPFEARLLVVMTGISALMVIRAAHSLVMSPASITENAAPLVFSLLLTTLVVVLQRPLASLSGRETEVSSVTWSVTTSALVLGVGMFFGTAGGVPGVGARRHQRGVSHNGARSRVIERGWVRTHRDRLALAS